MTACSPGTTIAAMGFERGWQYEGAQERALRRLAACTYTARIVSAELAAPEDIEAKADLLLAAEDLFSEAERLVAIARAIAWGDVETSGPRNDDHEVQAE